ncbi:hypothetical protein BaRGS_00015516 [Batillaria attramentaria]|uniref:Uncharacterized protein n=1 Tax=Batillaria attramentaria TaxID=370345 RepID=A0ABD0L249_9CAEN
MVSGGYQFWMVTVLVTDCHTSSGNGAREGAPQKSGWKRPQVESPAPCHSCKISETADDSFLSLNERQMRSSFSASRRTEEKRFPRSQSAVSTSPRGIRWLQIPEQTRVDYAWGRERDISAMGKLDIDHQSNEPLRLCLSKLFRPQASFTRAKRNSSAAAKKRRSRRRALSLKWKLTKQKRRSRFVKLLNALKWTMRKSPRRGNNAAILGEKGKLSGPQNGKKHLQNLQVSHNETDSDPDEARNADDDADLQSLDFNPDWTGINVLNYDAEMDLRSLDFGLDEDKNSDAGIDLPSFDSNLDEVQSTQTNLQSMDSNIDERQNADDEINLQTLNSNQNEVQYSGTETDLQSLDSNPDEVQNNDAETDLRSLDSNLGDFQNADAEVDLKSLDFDPGEVLNYDDEIITQSLEAVESHAGTFERSNISFARSLNVHSTKSKTEMLLLSAQKVQTRSEFPGDLEKEKTASSLDRNSRTPPPQQTLAYLHVTTAKTPKPEQKQRKTDSRSEYEDDRATLSSVDVPTSLSGRQKHVFPRPTRNRLPRSLGLRTNPTTESVGSGKIYTGGRTTRGKRRSNYGRILAAMDLSKDLRALTYYLAGHKYFGFDPRKGNKVMWKYRKKVSVVGLRSDGTALWTFPCAAADSAVLKGQFL